MKGVSTEKLETPTEEVLENALKRQCFLKKKVLAWLGYSKKAEVTVENSIFFFLHPWD